MVVIKSEKHPITRMKKEAKIYMVSSLSVLIVLLSDVDT